MDFKIGDQVKVVKRCDTSGFSCGRCDLTIGKVGTIAWKDEDEQNVWAVKVVAAEIDFFLAEQLELVSDEA